MEKLLDVKNVKKYFDIKAKGFRGENQTLKAVDDVSFELYKGEILGIVGESGCGKSTLGKTILRLHEKTDGEVLYRGKEIFSLHPDELKNMRQQMQMIFQDPFSSLNPRKNVYGILKQPFDIHKTVEKSKIFEEVEHLLEEVGLDPRYLKRYPHQFSGGQRQRIGIARALALKPEIIVCDEAVSALDVSIQAQILNLLLDLQEKYGLTYIFIAHDLSVVEFISTRIIVMYLGRIVEIADKRELVDKHVHPYTKALFKASPEIDTTKKGFQDIVLGDVPSPINQPSGCYFHPRCPLAEEKCKSSYPELKEIGPNHFVACHRA